MQNEVSESAVPVPAYPDLSGKVAVVTGGSKGIGAATCMVLAANGVRVAVSGRDPSSIASVVKEIQASGGTAVGVAADCTRSVELDALRDQVEQEFGPADILVAFAGQFSNTPFQDITEESWRTIIDANTTATFLTLKAFLPGMIERRAGAVVTMASNAGRVLDMPASASYAAAKAGVIMLTRHVAKEVGQHGVRVNCVAPATTLSERVKGHMPAEVQARVAAMAPLGRLGLPEDSALATLFLVSAASSWLTGVTLDVAGGRVML